MQNLRVSSLDSDDILSLPDDAKVSEHYGKNDFFRYEPGSREEEEAFRCLYVQLAPMWRRLQHDDVRETIVVVPSLSLDAEELRKIKGIEYYEERLLFLLLLLKNPTSEIIFVTSLPVRERIIDYYLQLLPGVPYSHARRRLHMFSTDDASCDKSLTQKVLERPALIKRMRAIIKNAEVAHLSVFNVTGLEKTLSVALGIPLLGAEPRHLHFGTKSGSRKLFREAGVLFPDGFEDLKTPCDMAEALAELRLRHEGLKRAVLKINEGFSGEGNAIYSYAPLEKYMASLVKDRHELARAILDTLPEHTKMQAENLSWEEFSHKFAQMEGVAEEFLEGCEKESPSVQTRLTPLGEVQVISTHDQIMGGSDGQVFLGCRFPAAPPFCRPLSEGGLKIGNQLTKHGLCERVSIDYMAVPRDPMRRVSSENPWDLYAIEINLRKGGTTHPFRTLQFLTDGHYNAEEGIFTTPAQEPKYYIASDNLASSMYKGLLPEDVIDITTYANLHYNTASKTGVIFHIIGACSQYGKLGVTCIENTPERAQMLYEKTIATLNAECRGTRWLI